MESPEAYKDFEQNFSDKKGRKLSELSEKEKHHGRRLKVFEKHSKRNLLAKYWPRGLQEFMEHEKNPVADLMCNAHLDGKACDMSGRSLAELENYKRSQRRRLSTVMKSSKRKLSDADKKNRKLDDMGRSPSYGSGPTPYDMDFTYEDDPIREPDPERAMDDTLAREVEVRGDRTSQDLESIYKTARNEQDCSMSMPAQNEGGQCGDALQERYEGMVEEYNEYGRMPDGASDQRLLDGNRPSVTTEDLRQTKDCKHEEKRPFDILEAQDLILSGSDEVVFAMTDAHYRRRGLMASIKQANACRRCPDSGGVSDPYCAIDSSMAGDIAPARGMDDDTLEVSVGELEDFILDCDAAPMSPAQEYCRKISQDGPTCTRARDVLARLNERARLDPEKILTKRDFQNVENEDQCNIAAPREGEDDLATTGEVVMAEIQERNGEGADCVLEDTRDARMAGEINME
jgi:hypothetical protein